ncbi:glycosyltransferase family 2 protein [Sphingomonas sp. Leaf242]|uniref:glycosyltransferase family 2 protein n=1 Tax=Sphingomonas sp. Leaf242 TaxID=1736304 RepID=UPI0009EA3187|nr:glycosyltransferase [Sphingomonas sp. Leaf242]
MAKHSRDAAIWVQLGHALKENGSLGEALDAYQTALARMPRDADLLLNIGHVHKLMGDMEKALIFYRRSAESNGNRHALFEIDALNQLNPSLETQRVRQKALPDAILAISKQSIGLSPIEANDVSLTNKNRLKFSSLDPWITFSLDTTIAAVSGIGLLTIQASAIDKENSLNGQLYIDYGDGFDEKMSLPFSSSNKPVSLLLTHPDQIVRLRWDPDRKSNIIHLPSLKFTAIEDFGDAETVIREHAARDIDITPLIELARSCFARVPMKPREAAEASLILMVSEFDLDAHYRRWLFKYERPLPEDYAIIDQMTAAMTMKPSFSFVMPTYNTPLILLRACLDAMLEQTYPDFEICVADDHSPKPEVVEVLAEYARRDPRVKYVRSPKNGHISDASNRALALATGDFIVLVDHDDVIPDYTLFVVAHYINRHPNADVLFSDEDKIDLHNNRSAPYFKGAFSKFLMYGHNMVSHLGVYRRSLVNEIGGFRLGLEGSQDYDLLLRCYERSSDERIVHIPHVLYHWRTTPGSTAISPDQKGYAIVAAQLAINGHFERTGMPLRSGNGFAPGCTGVSPSRAFDTSISIIIPTRNGLDVLEPCITSILATVPEHVEILIVDNGSDDPATLAYLDALATAGTARVLRYDQPFNFSMINNFAAEQAQGDLLCFLNNDTEILSGDWLARARALLSLDEVGIVGARLLYPDRTLQHFGIALGMGDHRVAGTPHGGMNADDPGYFGKARLMQEFSAVTAACLFIRRSDFTKVGGFDPELRVAYNDVDLCLKIRATGLKVVGDPEIMLIHKESRTRGSDKKGARAERLAKEAEWMRDKWSDLLTNDPYYSPNLSLDRLDFSPATPPRTPMPWQRGYATDVES